MFLHRLISLLVTAVLAFALVVACGRNLDHSATSSKQPLENCRKVQHSMGEACVPLHPQRVVTIHSSIFANAIALGIQPIATAYDMTEPFPTYLRGKVNGVELIGDLTQPNLEKILRLKPDLILGNPWAPNNYQQLSNIAPTVIPFRDLSWEQDLTELAQILGKEKAGAQLIEAYWQRIEQLKQALGNRRYQMQISVAGTFPEYIYAYGLNSAPGVILNDAELQRPPSQRKNSYYVENISEESLSEIDGDVLFCVVRGGDEGKEKLLQRLTQKPLWQQLKAVQQNHAYLVDYHWHHLDILAMNAIVDDLFKYLVNTL
ncbi:periplasmic binding protein (plasmid) [Gloeocapsa sp. PCC 7428]|uniref:iron-siderophore ABC transporter substrate-binding protein n=1 Tax=Gloeocapsa sp. PCC 7428 TaxID=1173026 RepID=UPI0002A5E247|nr:iron-siderophore ABC transporter substrate-binding protein [Gloeocapsa sp. PCC 7428]AFZ33339.1 periplasmic binding protein [Gloeocapsa sp. PCC 7428]